MGTDKRDSLKKSPPSLRKINFILLSLLFSFLSFSGYQFFKITIIECRQNQQQCSQEVLDKLNHLKGKSLFFTDFEKTLSQFEKYQVSKKLPNTLILQLSKTKSSYYQLDEDKTILTVEQETLDKTLNEQINTLFIELDRYEINYEKISLKEDIFIILLEEDIKVLVNKDDEKNGVYKLNQILKNIKLKEVDTAIKEIDTRFKMPVL